MNVVTDLLERFPAARPALLELTAEGERRVWHFGELIAQSAGLSGAFAARGVGRGDVVMTLCASRLEWVLAMLACWRMGAVAMPCSTQLRAGDLAARCAATNPSLCVGEADLLGALPAGVEAMDMADVERVLDEDLDQETPVEAIDLDASDPALVIFTSGTTGAARPALHGQGYIPGQSLQAEHWLGAGPDDLVWCTAAPGWSKSSRNVFLAPWLRGAAAMVHDARFDASERLEICRREGVSVLCQAPTEYRMLAKRTEVGPLPEMRRMVAAGEALGTEVGAHFRERTGLAIADGYGQTETGQITGWRPGEDPVAGSMGTPLPGIETRIAEDGELQVLASSVPTFFLGYLDEDGGPRLLDGGWWATGDYVSAREDGALVYEGRSDDVISSSGYRIGPAEVESALGSHPAVAEAAAIGVTDPERGQIVKAYVVLREGAPGEELARALITHARAESAPYKAPRRIEFIDELPKTATGKVRRVALRERESGGD
ncbi:AMP-binding protein [Thermoleophilia bacterium SCSIO 60948]|nr:AMP-binding protein [Thermoleophilia bacterium SCSIO 60948]